MPDWEQEDNGKVAVNTPYVGTWSIDGTGLAQASLYTARGSDEYYLDLLLKTPLGRTIKIVDKVRFGPRFIKRVELEIASMEAGDRTKAKIMQGLVNLLARDDCELDNILRDHISRDTFKDDEMAWRAHLRADLYRYYGN